MTGFSLILGHSVYLNLGTLKTLYPIEHLPLGAASVYVMLCINQAMLLIFNYKPDISLKSQELIG